MIARGVKQSKGRGEGVWSFNGGFVQSFLEAHTEE
jgi:hypothetical protein